MARGVPAKPAREVHTGDCLRIITEGGEFQVEVLQLSEIRGPAAVAQTLYRETEESRELRRKAAEERHAMPRIQPLPDGKLSKRDRREFDRFRGRV